MDIRAPARIFLVAVLLTLAGLPAGVVSAQAPGPFEAVLDARMPGLLARYGVPGAAIAYIANGEVSWSRAWGLADVATGRAMTPDMPFNHGSTGKVLTAWGVMRLVDEGRLDLDAPINDYLRRWQIASATYDAVGVTARRLLSHTAGLSVSGYSDYSPRRRLPSLVEVLEGRNQQDGAVAIVQAPGSGFKYSGGGYALLQMAIEDITGMPFAAYMAEAVTGPLGLPAVAWTWTPDLAAQAPTPYGPQGEALEYRQLAAQAVGSEIATVSDYARWVAAAVEGPEGEPAGRGVLAPETIAAMTTVQPGATDEGLGYGVTPRPGGVLLQHFGSNPGWTSFFSLDTGRREGLVMANNSSNGFELNAAVQNLWLAWLDSGVTVAREPEPVAGALPTAALLVLALAVGLGVPLVVRTLLKARDVRAGRRGSGTPGWRWAQAVIWLSLLAAWLYWFYTALPLPFGPGVPDLWRMPQTHAVTAVLAAWVVMSITRALLARGPGSMRPTG